MRKKKFLSVLLAVSLTMSLLAGVAGAESNINPDVHNNLGASFTAKDGTAVTTTASSRAKLLLFYTTDSSNNAACTTLSTDALSQEVSNYADVIQFFVNSSDTAGAVTNFSGAKLVDSSDDTKKLFSDYVKLYGLSIDSSSLPVAVLINKSNRTVMLSTGTDGVMAEIRTLLSVGNGQNANSADGGSSDREWELLRLTNKARAAAGKAPLTTFGKLQMAAHDRAQELVGYYGHYRPKDNAYFTNVFSQVGITTVTSAENILSRKTSASDALDAWQTSSNQYERDNIVSNTKHVGSGYAEGGTDSYYWEQLYLDDGCTYESAKVTDAAGTDYTATVTTSKDKDGNETKTVSGTVFQGSPAGTSMDDMNLTLHLTGSNGTDYICPLTSELCPDFKAKDYANTQLVTVSACKQTTQFQIKMADPVVKSLAVKTNPTKTTYIVGDKPDLTGLVLTATMSDDTTKDVTYGTGSGITSAPDELASVGDNQPVTVSYGGKSTTFNTTVTWGVAVKSIAVKTNPKKILYAVGEAIDTTGLELTVTLNDEQHTQQIVSSDVTGLTFSPANAPSTAGSSTVTVNFGGQSTTYPITVVQSLMVTKLALNTAPKKTSYAVGEKFDPTGMSITATMEDGSTLTVSDTSKFACTPLTAFTAVGTAPITVSYLGASFTFDVTVDGVLESIAVTTNPTTTGYVKGATLSTAGMVVTAHYQNSTVTKAVTGYTCSPTTLSTSGTQTITVTYGGKTATFTVSVTDASVSALSVKTKPTTLTFYRGDTLVTTGLVLTATMTDGKTQDVSTGFTTSPTTLTSNGTQTVTVTYGNKSTTYTVTVTEPVYTAIAVKTPPVVTVYDQGAALQTAGLTLTATLANKSTREITSGFSCTPMLLKAGGKQTITVTYAGLTTTFDVNVTEKKANAAFVDVVANQWFYKYVNDLTKRGLLSGTNNYDGTYSFRPESSISRAEFAAILARASGANLGAYSYSSFADVPVSHWACQSVSWARSAGIVTGSSGYFRPNDNVTRQEMAVMLTRFSVYEGKSITMDKLPANFTDKAYIASWAQNSVYAMQKANIINGIKNSNGTFSFWPTASTTRAQAAKVVSAYLAK